MNKVTYAGIAGAAIVTAATTWALLGVPGRGSPLPNRLFGVAIATATSLQIGLVCAGIADGIQKARQPIDRVRQVLDDHGYPTANYSDEEIATAIRATTTIGRKGETTEEIIKIFARTCLLRSLKSVHISTRSGGAE